GTYSYTDSENRKTGAQLIFVPYHKGTCLATYSFNRFELSAETLFTGEVFTRSDNNARYNLEGYAIVNGGLALVLDRRLKSKIGINVRNVGNSQYMTQPRRPYPGRHYAINLIFNF
ncbi:MAG TPA: TonB-dependent receptor, partial [Flavobacterium sp.]|nr:TonB-dependent receptor [Flavobacterium sp.]